MHLLIERRDPANPGHLLLEIRWTWSLCRLPLTFSNDPNGLFWAAPFCKLICPVDLVKGRELLISSGVITSLGIFTLQNFTKFSKNLKKQINFNKKTCSPLLWAELCPVPHPHPSTHTKMSPC